MAGKRMISQDILSGDRALDLSVEERFFLIGLYLIADDQGRFRANTLWLRSNIFPYDDLDVSHIDKLMLAVADYVIVYEVDGRLYGQIIDWWESQSLQWAKESDHPAPDGWEDRIRMMVYDQKRWVMTQNWPNSEDKLSPDSLPNKPPNKVTKPDNININNNNNSNDKETAESKPKRAKKPTTNPQSLMIEALAEVMDVDPVVNAKRLARTAAALRNKQILGVDVTPELIKKLYGRGGWYYKFDWRGQQGQVPSQDVFTKTIQQAIRWKLSPHSANARKKSPATSSSTTAKPKRVAPGAV